MRTDQKDLGTDHKWGGTGRKAPGRTVWTGGGKILPVRTSRDRLRRRVRVEIGGSYFPEEKRNSVFPPWFFIRKGG